MILWIQRQSVNTYWGINLWNQKQFLLWGEGASPQARPMGGKVGGELKQPILRQGWNGLEGVGGRNGRVTDLRDFVGEGHLGWKGTGLTKRMPARHRKYLIRSDETSPQELLFLYYWNQIKAAENEIWNKQAFIASFAAQNVMMKIRFYKKDILLCRRKSPGLFTRDWPSLQTSALEKKSIVTSFKNLHSKTPREDYSSVTNLLISECLQ